MKNTASCQGLTCKVLVEGSLNFSLTPRMEYEGPERPAYNSGSRRTDGRVL